MQKNIKHSARITVDFIFLIYDKEDLWLKTNFNEYIKDSLKLISL